jgi:hypothetical protein
MLPLIPARAGEPRRAPACEKHLRAPLYVRARPRSRQVASMRRLLNRVPEPVPHDVALDGREVR